MKLIDYLKKKGLSQSDFQERLCGTPPTKQAVSRYINGADCPSVEVALLIARATNGEVMPHELLVDKKRRYTESGDSIQELALTQTLMEDLL